tara:strand:+ start:6799 stop:7302 length:504 start_codon:yes stop_codon:yes gene_type:complete
MQILTLDNTTYPLNSVPDEVDDNMRFSVLDNSDSDNPDFFFIPLIFLESFSSPAVVMEIGQHKIQMPIDWHVVIGDKEVGDLEVVPITSLNDRGFDCFCYNPVSDVRPDFAPINITNVFSEIKWYFPKLRPGQILAIPLESGDKPRCAFFVKDIARQSETIKYSNLW